MDITLSRDTFLKLENDEILTLLNDMTQMGIYTISTAWRESAKFILKGKGRKGDIVITWK